MATVLVQRNEGKTMQFKAIFHLVGLSLFLFSFSMLPPLLINFIFGEAVDKLFVLPFLSIMLPSLGVWLYCKQPNTYLGPREGFLIVVIIWVAISLLAALPFILYDGSNYTITDAIFETVSGITTTGAECFDNLKQLPHALLFYHQLLQFIGGMGIVALAVAIFPMLGLGGMQLFKVEVSNPGSENKLTPRITKTAKNLWIIYCLITMMCAFCYWYAGMDWFHALGESFGTVSTGGFSMHDAGFLFYNSRFIEGIAILFMWIGGISFSLHYLVFHQRNIRLYWRNEELRYYLKISLGVLVIILALLQFNHFYAKTSLSVIDVIFNVVSITTTTGFSSTTIDNWPMFAPILIIIASMVGGCSGSTTGGIKMLRLLLIWKHCKRESMSLLHPQGIFSIKFNRHTVSQPILQSVLAFVAVYLGWFTLLMLAFMMFDNDFITSFSAIAAGLTNSGVGIGAVKNTFVHLNNPSKWLVILAMISGRLEIFPLFILFSKDFWRQ